MDKSIDAALIPCQPNTTNLGAYAATTRHFQGIPGIERTANGRLFACWYSGGTTECHENHVLLAQSNGKGAVWQDPIMVIDPPGTVRAFDPVLWIDPGERLWFFWSQCSGHFDGRGGLWAMRCDAPDAGTLRWSAPSRLCNGIMMNKPTVCANGEWLLPTAIWKHCTIHPGCEDEQFSNVVVSIDEGKTWALRGKADVPMRECDEHMLVERRDGSLWMLVRTLYGIGECFSRDGGRTWSPGMPTTIPSPVSRFFIRRLQSKRLLLITHAYSQPNPENNGTRPTRSHLTAYLSEDEGRTWIGGLLIDERQRVSYPDAKQSPDGTIHMIYDRDRNQAGEIIITSFSEQEILPPGSVLPPDRRTIISHLSTKT